MEVIFHYLLALNLVSYRVLMGYIHDYCQPPRT